MGSRLQEAFLRPAARLPRERKHASRRSTWDGEQTTRSLPSTSSKVTKGTETCKPPEHLGWGADYKKPSFDQQQGYQGNGNMQAAGAPGMGSRLQEAFLRPAARLPRERKHASRRSTWDGERAGDGARQHGGLDHRQRR